MSLLGRPWWSNQVSEPEPPAVVHRRLPARFRILRIAIMNMDTFVQTVVIAHRHDTTDHVKAKIQVKFGIPPEHQRLMLRTTELTDGEVWNHLKFEQSEVLYMSLTSDAYRSS